MGSEVAKVEDSDKRVEWEVHFNSTQDRDSFESISCSFCCCNEFVFICCLVLLAAIESVNMLSMGLGAGAGTFIFLYEFEQQWEKWQIRKKTHFHFTRESRETFMTIFAVVCLKFHFACFYSFTRRLIRMNFQLHLSTRHRCSFLFFAHFSRCFMFMNFRFFASHFFQQSAFRLEHTFISWANKNALTMTILKNMKSIKSHTQLQSIARV